jgi:hypothetical protein
MGKPEWWEPLMKLLLWRMRQGWFYSWGLGYNNIIDWTGHPGMATDPRLKPGI